MPAFDPAALYKYDGEPHMLVDIGANLADDAFEKDIGAVLARAKEAHVDNIVITGSSIDGSEEAAALAEAYEGLWCTAGVHPHNAKHCDENTIAQLRELAKHPKCVALGECGLDFNRNFSTPDVQEEWFDKQVALACELQMPLFIHCREAADRLRTILSRHALTAPAVVHCFTGTDEELKSFVEMGLYIGITGWVCDDREGKGEALAKTLPTIPLDRLMIETDAPYLTPRSIKPNRIRPHRNEPALLPHVLAKVAQSIGQPMGATAELTTANAKRFFSLP